MEEGQGWVGAREIRAWSSFRVKRGGYQQAQDRRTHSGSRQPYCYPKPAPADGENAPTRLVTDHASLGMRLKLKPVFRLTLLII